MNGYHSICRERQRMPGVPEDIIWRQPLHTHEAVPDCAEGIA